MQLLLTVPTVLDRFIQQALHQVLSPVFELGFSESSYGFRPGRSAGQAVQQARDYVEAGYRGSDRVAAITANFYSLPAAARAE